MAGEGINIGGFVFPLIADGGGGNSDIEISGNTIIYKGTLFSDVRLNGSGDSWSNTVPAGKIRFCSTYRDFSGTYIGPYGNPTGKSFIAPEGTVYGVNGYTAGSTYGFSGYLVDKTSEINVIRNASSYIVPAGKKFIYLSGNTDSEAFSFSITGDFTATISSIRIAYEGKTLTGDINGIEIPAK